jgi:hypothetical protein
LRPRAGAEAPADRCRALEAATEMGRGRGFGGKNSTRGNAEQDASPGMAAIENSATADFVVVDDIPGPASLGTTALSPALRADRLAVGSRAYTTFQMSSPPLLAGMLTPHILCQFILSEEHHEKNAELAKAKMALQKVVSSCAPVRREETERERE